LANHRFQPFSLWRYKEWSSDKYIRLIERVLSAMDISIVITGSQQEHERAKDLINRCAALGCKDHDGRNQEGGAIGYLIWPAKHP